MVIVQINKLTQPNGVNDYKGLDLELIQAGTQIYPPNTNSAYFYYNGDVVTHPDILVIDQATYDSVKNAPSPPNFADRLASVESAITALMGV